MPIPGWRGGQVGATSTLERVNGQHRGDGQPYGSDEPTPRPSGQEAFRPRHGSPWPDDEAPAADHPYGPGRQAPGAPYGGGADPYAGGADPYPAAPRGPEPQSPYPPAGPGPQARDPYPSGPYPTSPPPQSTDPYAGGPQGGAPYGGAPQSADPYASGPQSGPQGGAPYGTGPQGADPYGGAPSADGGQFSAGALGGGRFGADALGGGPRPDVPGDVRPGPQASTPPRHPSEETTAHYQRRPEWQEKPYAPPNASTEALPQVGSRDQRVAGAGMPPAPERPRPAPPAEDEQDLAAPTSAFRAFAAGESAGDADEGGYPGYSRIRDDEDAYDEGGSSAPTWSLVLGIIGIVAMPLLGLGVIASVAALFTARSAARATRGGSGLITAGRFLGWVGIGLFVVGLVGGAAYALL